MLTLLCLLLTSYYFYKLYNVIYNHPLSKIPGPISHLIFPYMMNIYIILGSSHKKILSLHEEYGKVVRLGWNRVSFSDEEAMKQIYSTYNYKKDRMYSDFDINGENIFTTRDKSIHRIRKSIIGPSFSNQNILGYENTIKQLITTIIEKVEININQNQSVDLTKYFNSLTMDMIGELCFGKNFDILKTGHHPILSYIKSLLIYSALTIVFPFFKNYQLDGVKKLYEFTHQAIENSNPKKNTILQAIINGKSSETNEKLTNDEIVEEALAQILVGTDTTANTLSWVFYLLLKNPECMKKLRDEIKQQFNTIEDINYSQCKESCVYLNAVINETLRLYPAAAGDLPRMVPKGGSTILDYYLPEETSVAVNLYALHRLSSFWEQSDKFLPERWIKDGKLQSLKNYSPFLIGPRACIGRNLAWLELYLTVASLLFNFNFKLEQELEINDKFHVVLALDTPLIVNASLIN